MAPTEIEGGATIAEKTWLVVLIFLAFFAALAMIRPIQWLLQTIESEFFSPRPHRGQAPTNLEMAQLFAIIAFFAMVVLIVRMEPKISRLVSRSFKSVFGGSKSASDEGKNPGSG